MISNLTSDVLELIAICSDLSKDQVVLKNLWRENPRLDTKTIRKDQFFFKEGVFNTQSFVNYQVPKNQRCSCSWPSAYGTFEIVYEAYKVPVSALSQGHDDFIVHAQQQTESQKRFLNPETNDFKDVRYRPK